MYPPSNPDYRLPIDALPGHYRSYHGVAAAISTGVAAAPDGFPGFTVVNQTSGQFLSWTIDVLQGGSQPSGAALVLDVQQSTNGGASYASMFGGNTALMPTLPPGTNTISGQFNAPGYVNHGDQLQIDVIQVGSGAAGQNVRLTLFGPFIVD